MLKKPSKYTAMFTKVLDKVKTFSNERAAEGVLDVIRSVVKMG